jgi:hypothetical protein
MRRYTLTLVLSLAAFAPSVRGETCARHPPPPLQVVLSKAPLVLHVEVDAPPVPPGDKPAERDGSFRILEVLKGHAALGQARSLPARGYMRRFGTAPKSRWILLCEVDKQGMVEPSRMLLSGSPASVNYARGLLRLAGDPVKLLRHCLDYLEHADEELASDAITELYVTPGRHLRAAARTLSAERVAGWLRNPKTHVDRLSIYGLLLGYCGQPRHAELVRKALVGELRREYILTDTLLVGYTLLRPEEGWPLVQRLLREHNPGTAAQMSALKAVRHFWDECPDVLPRTDLLRALVPLLRDSELTDAILYDLRRWQRWEFTDLVLHHWERLPPEAGRIRQALVCFALRSPRPQAAAFVERLRRTEPDTIESAELILRLERDLRKSP